jgi:hypothetical protein
MRSRLRALQTTVGSALFQRTGDGFVPRGTLRLPFRRIYDARCLMLTRRRRMCTTLTIDDDVLTAAKAIAQQTHKSIGEVISQLARSSLRPPAERKERNGIPLLSVRKPGVIVTPEIVNALRDELL